MEWCIEFMVSYLDHDNILWFLYAYATNAWPWPRERTFEFA
jgi:hypothetical protein